MFQFLFSSSSFKDISSYEGGCLTELKVDKAPLTAWLKGLLQETGSACFDILFLVTGKKTRDEDFEVKLMKGLFLTKLRSQ